MSEPVNKPTEVSPEVKPEELTLGSRGSIRLTGLYPDKRRKSKLITAHFDDGLLNPDGKPHIHKYRTGVSNTTVATALADARLECLKKQWDDRAAQSGRATEGPGSAVVNANPTERTVRQLFTALMTLWASVPDSKTLECYMVVIRSFLRCARDLADRPRRCFTPDECQKIWKEMCSRWNADTDTVRQNARNTRFVLTEIGFTHEVISIFSQTRERRGPRTKNRSFLPEEQKTMWNKSQGVEWVDEGIFVVSANGTMNLGDLVFLETRELLEAREAALSKGRMKNGNRFRMYPWPRTNTWFDQREEPDAVYLLWMLIFSEEELAKDPDILYRRRTPEEIKARKDTVKARGRRIFEHFLRVTCEITRDGASHKCFRNTNVSTWEAAGVPRQVGKDASGHTTDTNYAGYADPTVGQMKSLSKLTQDSYENPKDFNILTHDQAVDANKENTMQIVGEAETRIKDDTAKMIAASETRMKAEADKTAQNNEERHRILEAKMDLLLSRQCRGCDHFKAPIQLTAPSAMGIPTFASGEVLEGANIRQLTFGFIDGASHACAA